MFQTRESAVFCRSSTSLPILPVVAWVSGCDFKMVTATAVENRASRQRIGGYVVWRTVRILKNPGISSSLEEVCLFKVGRDTANEFWITTNHRCSVMISRVHCHLMVDNGVLKIKDVSRGGTWVDNVKLQGAYQSLLEDQVVSLIEPNHPDSPQFSFIVERLPQQQQQATATTAHVSSLFNILSHAQWCIYSMCVRSRC
eukprot:g11690.t1